MQEEPTQMEEEETAASEVIPMDDGNHQPQPVSERKTTRYLTKYERARILGTRALQIRFVCICF
jgi:DNA-directed RNA polymerases I, II, and III subunit RPABC2